MMLKFWCLGFFSRVFAKVLAHQGGNARPAFLPPQPLFHSPASSPSSSLCFNYLMLISIWTFISKNRGVQMKSDMTVNLKFKFQNFPVL